MENIESESFNQNIAEYHQKIADIVSRQKESDSASMSQVLTPDETINFYCLVFDELLKDQSINSNSIFKRKHLISVIPNLKADGKTKDKYCDFIDQPLGWQKISSALHPLIDEFFEQKRLSKIFAESPELKEEKYFKTKGKSKKNKRKRNQNSNQVFYVFESCVYNCSYSGNKVQKKKDCGWKLTDDDLQRIVKSLESLQLSFVTSFKVAQCPASMRFMISPIVSSDSPLAVKESDGFPIDLQVRDCRQLEPSHLDWTYYCNNQYDTTSIADRLIYIAEGSNDFGNKVAGYLVPKKSLKPSADVVAKAAEEFADRIRQQELQGIPQQLTSIARKVIDMSDFELYRDVAGVSADNLVSQFNEQYADLENEIADLKFYSKNAVGIDVNGTVGFDLINRKFFLDESEWRKLKRIDTRARLLPEIDRAISFAKSTASSKGIGKVTVNVKKTLFKIELDDGITKNNKLNLHYTDPESWTEDISKFLDDCHEKTLKKRKSIQNRVNGSGLVGNIIATAVAELVLNNEKKDGRYHLTANNCAAMLRDMSTANKFYADINHTRYDKLFRLIPGDEVERIIELVVDKGLVDESYHRISDYNVSYYSLIPNEYTKIFVSNSLASTKLSTDFGLLARLEELTASSGESESVAEIGDKGYIELLQNLTNHPAVWCYKPEVCRQFLQLKPEVAQKLLKVYTSIEDDRFKKNYLKLLTKETKLGKGKQK